MAGPLQMYWDTLKKAHAKKKKNRKEGKKNMVGRTGKPIYSMFTGAKKLKEQKKRNRKALEGMGK